VLRVCPANATHPVHYEESHRFHHSASIRNFWQAAESVLNEGESLSLLTEESLRSSDANRQQRREIVARGLASCEEARRTGEYFAEVEPHTELGVTLAAAQKSKADH
jgi:hypothetical protein